MVTGNLKKLILNLQDELFSTLNLTPQIGFELEFYLTDLKGNQIDHPQASLLRQLLAEQNIILEEEKGRGQFEVHSNYTSDLPMLTTYLEELKAILGNYSKACGFLVNFDPKPFPKDYGSSLHVHLNFLNKEEKKIFSLADTNQSYELKKCIYGILDIIREGIYFFGGEKDFSRFSAKFMAPINISWGGNNRTTAIRVPDSKPEFRRIELRVPSANASLEKVIAFILIGALHGLKNENLYYERIYGNAFDEQYALQLLPKDLKEAENIFHEQGVLKNYLEEFQYYEREEKNI
ncbi:hypothetical protein NF27_EY02280 [Candidatus Jidaibacter acanthamoeba]|uniref:GS catalytic domain-containing protein n=1 Tax=Candidatus Jidaibacter acanthamoebae TaxID=86105 RepID=A0A0C1MST3_9RICK|nr:hypothetical protein [Candidatus Jidaibacter acanthamoeba]KIE05132.1 hypothetical protein NF27_EY02280 [Candidatus Jidaibacter acanthamoeba]